MNDFIQRTKHLFKTPTGWLILAFAAGVLIYILWKNRAGAKISPTGSNGANPLDNADPTQTDSGNTGDPTGPLLPPGPGSGPGGSGSGSRPPGGGGSGSLPPGSTTPPTGTRPPTPGTGSSSSSTQTTQVASGSPILPILPRQSITSGPPATFDSLSALPKGSANAITPTNHGFSRANEPDPITGAFTKGDVGAHPDYSGMTKGPPAAATHPTAPSLTPTGPVSLPHIGPVSVPHPPTAPHPVRKAPPAPHPKPAPVSRTGRPPSHPAPPPPPPVAPTAGKLR